MRQTENVESENMYETWWFRAIMLAFLVVVCVGVWFISTHPSQVMSWLGQDHAKAEKPTIEKPTVGGTPSTQ